MEWIKCTPEVFKDEDWDWKHYRYLDKAKLETHLWEVKDGYLQKIGGTGALPFDQIEWLDESHPLSPVQVEGGELQDEKICFECHAEIIKCPECNTIQAAVVEHTVPFYSYVHECKNCKYIIMESEWVSVPAHQQASMGKRYAKLSEVMNVIDEWLKSDDVFVTETENGVVIPGAWIDCVKGSLLKRMAKIIPAQM